MSFCQSAIILSIILQNILAAIFKLDFVLFQLWAVLVTILVNLTCVPAPVPRCSFFIIINKLSEYSNILSDANPYFPVPPCKCIGICPACIWTKLVPNQFSRVNPSCITDCLEKADSDAVESYTSERGGGK
jgi:hypothetical protein